MSAAAAIAVNPAAIPTDLQPYNHFIVWKLKPDTKGKLAKVPYNPANGHKADTTDPTTWRGFDEALAAYRRGGYAGIGFVFAEDDPFTGIDLDHAFESAGGTIAPWAKAIVERFNSYTERSPSGTGLHILIRGTVPDGVGHKRPLRKTPLWEEGAHPDAAIEM